MGNLRASSAIAMLALAACGSDHAAPDASIKIVDAMPDMKVWMDAPPGPTYDFSCMGNSAPTTASANITLSGTAQRVYLNGTQPAVEALEGAAVKACKSGTTCMGPNEYGTDTSAADGSWSIGPFATGGTPVDGFVEVSAANARTTAVYPAGPTTADLGNIPVLTFDPGFIQLLANFGCPQDDTTNGIVTLAITDCANTPIDDTSNTMLSIQQGGSEVQGTSVLDLGQLSSMAAGTYMVCNVPENAMTTVGATYKSMALRSHVVGVVKATSTITVVRPGF